LRRSADPSSGDAVGVRVPLSVSADGLDFQDVRELREQRDA
jgi:hypothetical protein